jgi:hypothetical protein
VNNNYNLNTVVAAVEQVDGGVKALESNCNVLVGKIFSPKKLSTGREVAAIDSEYPLNIYINKVPTIFSTSNGPFHCMRSLFLSVGNKMRTLSPTTNFRSFFLTCKLDGLLQFLP